MKAKYKLCSWENKAIHSTRIRLRTLERFFLNLAKVLPILDL